MNVVAIPTAASLTPEGPLPSSASASLSTSSSHTTLRSTDAEQSRLAALDREASDVLPQLRAVVEERRAKQDDVQATLEEALRSKAEEAILFLAHHPKVGPGCVGRYLLESASSPSMQRRKDKGRALVLCRLKLLEDLMGELSASLEGGSPTAKVEWPMETVATFCAGCIGHHKSTAVQNKARQVVSLVCKNGAHPALVGIFARFISVFA